MKQKEIAADDANPQASEDEAKEEMDMMSMFEEL